MQLRRKTALVVSALVFTAPVLTGCGFEVATDRANDITAGANNHDGKLDVLNAVLISDEDGAARFIATYSNQDTENAVTITDLAAGTGAEATITGFTPVKVPASALVTPQIEDPKVIVEGKSRNFTLESDSAQEVTEPITPGDYVRLVVSVSNGDEVELNVPVLGAWGEYAEWGQNGIALEQPVREAPAGHGEEG